MADVIVNADNVNPKELLAQGIRAFVLQDFSAAVIALSKVSELMVSDLGDDLHESLGDVYLYYGKSLLGLSRDENGALGDAVPRNNDEESDEEEDGGEAAEGDGEEDDKDAENAETDKNGDGEKNAEIAEEEKMDSKEESTDEKKDDISEVSTNGTSKVEASGSADDSDEKAENDEEPTDLQVAWEVLELAKKIFQKLGDSGKKNLAETLIVLGEISLESENFEAAISDIKEGLQIQEELFEKDSRTVAETYYKLGMAYSTNSQTDEAIANYRSSLEYLQNRINILEKKEDKKNGIEEEIKEIKNLIPDIEEKIVDLNSYKDEALKKILSAVTETKPLGESSTSEASSSKPVSNISHLVKRKRKLDEISDEKDTIDENPAKK